MKIGHCEIRLTRTERKLLDYFCCNLGRAVSYEELKAIPPYDERGNVRVVVHRIRRKVDVNIVALPGYGYRFDG